MSSGGAGHEVVLVRHAETAWTLTGQHTGRTDIPLTDSGRAHSAALAARVSAWNFALVLTSPLTRARETCELCGLGELAQTREDLLEWDYGDYDGLTTPEIRVDRPDWNLWRDGCPGGETAAEVGARADRVIEEIERADGAVALFSHGHLLRVLGARWIGLEAEHGGRLGLAPGAVCVLAEEHSRQILACWNDSSPPARSADVPSV